MKHRNTIQLAFGGSNIVGDHNVQHVETHHHHHQGAQPRKRGDDDARAIVGGIAMLMCLAVWQFMRHSEEIYNTLQYLAIASVLPVCLGALWKQEISYRNLFDGGLIMVVAVAVLMASIYAYDHLPSAIEEGARQASNGISFWLSLAPSEQAAAFHNVGAALLITASAVLTFTFSIHTGLCVAHGEDHTQGVSVAFVTIAVALTGGSVWLVTGN